MICSACRRKNPDGARFCSHCGATLQDRSNQPAKPGPVPGELNINVLYIMAALLVAAVMFPPWETPPSDPPEFLGLHPFWQAPNPAAVVSRMLLTIETITIAIAGMYLSWFFRGR